MKVATNNNETLHFEKPHLYLNEYKKIKIRKGRGNWSPDFRVWNYNGQQFCFPENPFNVPGLTSSQKRKLSRKNTRNKKALNKKQYNYNRFCEKIDNLPRVLPFIDLEMFEMNKPYLTEVGISFLNTKTGKIKTFHFIIKEYLEYKNKKFVENNKDNFEFGKSKIVSFKDCISFIEKIIKKGFIAGHCVRNDLKYLEDNYNFPYIETTIFDTHKLSFLLYGKSFSLKDCCNKFQIKETKFHNAGNDSHKTAELCFKLIKEFKLKKYELKFK